MFPESAVCERGGTIAHSCRIPLIPIIKCALLEFARKRPSRHPTVEVTFFGNKASASIVGIR